MYRVASFLLSDMGQFVGEQPCAPGRMRLVLTLAEHHMLAYGVSVSIGGAHGIGCPLVGVSADPAEVVTEPRLHEGACVLVKRTAGRA